MGKSTKSNALDFAVSDFVLGLDGTRKAQLAALFINSHACWEWYEEVIARYHLGDALNPVVADIHGRYSEECALSMIESDISGPVFEAGVFLREAKNLAIAE